MLIEDAHCLHEGMADRATDEAETAPSHVAAHRLALARGGGHVALIERAALDRAAAGESPDIAGEVARPTAEHEIGARIGDESIDLQAITHDPRVGEQTPAAAGIVARHALGIEPVEGAPVMLAPAQDREPGEAGLCALKTEHLEERTVRAQRHAPLTVVVLDVQRVGGAPGAPQAPVGVPANSHSRVAVRGRL